MERQIKLGDDPPDVGITDQGLDPLKHFYYQPFTGHRHTLFRIPGLDLLKIAQRGFGET